MLAQNGAMTEVTRILSQIELGDSSSTEQILPLVYDELRKLAALRLAQEPPGQTLQATALVHEVYLRLVDVDQAQRWRSRGHFFAAAAEAMRRILIERARSKQAQKKGGRFQRTSFDDGPPVSNDFAEELLEIDDELLRLAREDSVAAEVFQLRYFAGCSLDEVGEFLGVSRATVHRNWSFACAWLQSRISLGQ